ncbi:hypothetical protein HI914_04826 [Erysiphe necator]|nr:hypothetical protein HI914_04826 [Erysiphe necator]
MRLNRLCSVLWIAFGACSAQRNWTPKTSLDVIMESVGKLPKCCMGCVLPILSDLHCNMGNVTELVICFCSDSKVQKNVSECTGTNCSNRELKHSEELLQVICAGAPKPTMQPQIYSITTITSVVVSIFVALRCYSNYQISKKLWWDDGFLFISTVFFLAFQCLTFWGTSYGFGLHIWTANTNHWPGLLFFEWLWEIIYIIVQTMTKVSVLLLYYRIFPQLWFRRVLFTLIGGMFIHFIVFTAVIVTACKPIRSFWDKMVDGQCLDTRPVGLIGSAFSILEDVVFLCLPIPLIWKLKLQTSRKIGITLILTIGVIACAASIVRLRYLYQYNQTFDQIWENYLIVILSQIELSLSIICVCFPAIRLLFSRNRREDDGSSDSKATSAPSHSCPSVRPHSSSILSKIFSIISNNSLRSSMSMPWISSRAPQLSSIYITSHIELSDKDPSGSNSHIKDYKTHITSSKPQVETLITPLNSALRNVPGIMRVDKFGNLITPVRNLEKAIYQEDNENVSPIADRHNLTPDHIGTAK